MISPSETRPRALAQEFTTPGELDSWAHRRGIERFIQERHYAPDSPYANPRGFVYLCRLLPAEGKDTSRGLRYA